MSSSSSSSSSSVASILYEAAKETAVEYFQKTSLNGFGLLYYIRRRKYQRLFWFMFIVMGVAFATSVCLTIMISFYTEPTVTALDPQEHTIWDIPFPSIAVCSNNKLSQRAIREYAANLTHRSSNIKSHDYWLTKLQLFAGFFNTESIDFDEALELQTQLDEINGQTFDTEEVLKSLAPKCEDLLLYCFWAGQRINCLQALKSVAFVIGHCCVFNYKYKSIADELYYPNHTGREMGLSLILNASTNDYFYNEDSTNGFTIQIFGEQRIPDESTGDLAQFYAGAGDDIEIRLKLISQVTANEVRDHKIEKRGCYFANESKEAAFGQGACLLNCKIRSVKSLCGCTPYYVKDGNNQSLAQCSLGNTECLERYRVTWQTYNPDNPNINDHLKGELVDSLSCPECMPLCSYNRFEYFKTKNNLKDSYNYTDNRKFVDVIPKLSPDISLIKIYYPSAYGTKYQKNVLYNWYQILSNIGGVIGISMGCSIISGFEIIYFGIIRLLENFCRF